MKKYIVKLSEDEHKILKKLISSGRGPARMFTRAHILLKADQSHHGPAWGDEKISDAFDVTIQTVERIRKQLFYHVADTLKKNLVKRSMAMWKLA